MSLSEETTFGGRLSERKAKAKGLRTMQAKEHGGRGKVAMVESIQSSQVYEVARRAVGKDVG